MAFDLNDEQLIHSGIFTIPRSLLPPSHAHSNTAITAMNPSANLHRKIKGYTFFVKRNRFSWTYFQFLPNNSDNHKSPKVLLFFYFIRIAEELQTVNFICYFSGKTILWLEIMQIERKKYFLSFVIVIDTAKQTQISSK